MARLRIGVEATAERASHAVAQANTAMVRVLQALERAGVRKPDLGTTDLTIAREQVPLPPRPLAAGEVPAPSPRYRVSNMLGVNVRDLTQIGALLERAIEAGANQVWGLELALEAPERLREQARVAAVADARRTAEQLAARAGVALGAVTSIAELDSTGTPFLRNEAALSAVVGSVPIEPGQITVAKRVQMIFSIAERKP